MTITVTGLRSLSPPQRVAVLTCSRRCETTRRPRDGRKDGAGRSGPSPRRLFSFLKSRTFALPLKAAASGFRLASGTRPRRSSCVSGPSRASSVTWTRARAAWPRRRRDAARASGAAPARVQRAAREFLLESSVRSLRPSGWPRWPAPREGSRPRVGKARWRPVDTQPGRGPRALFTLALLGTCGLPAAPAVFRAAASRPSGRS